MNEIDNEIDNNTSILNNYNEYFDTEEDAYDIPYKTIEDLKENIHSTTYQISISDLEILSKKYKIGFSLYTNRYTTKDHLFELYIIIDDNILNKKTIMYNLYQDYPKDLKTIIYPTQNMIRLDELYKNTHFKKIFNRTYPKISL